MSIYLHSAQLTPTAPISIPPKEQSFNEQSISPPSDNVTSWMSSSAPPLLSACSSPVLERKKNQKGLSGTLPVGSSSSTSSLESLKAVENQLKDLRETNREKMRRRGRTDSVKRMSKEELCFAEVFEKLPSIRRWIKFTKIALIEFSETLYISKKTKPQEFEINKKKISIINTTGFSYTVTPEHDFILQTETVFAGGTEADVRYCLNPDTMKHFTIIRRKDENYTGARRTQRKDNPLQQVAGENQVKEICKNFKYLAQPLAFRSRISVKNEILVRYVYTLFPYYTGGDLDVKSLHAKKFIGDIPHGQSSLDGPLLFKIAYCIAKGIQELHKNNLVHRDIKPENIILHEGSALLVDFGTVVGKEEYNTPSSSAQPSSSSLRSGSFDLIRSHSQREKTSGLFDKIKIFSRPAAASMTALPDIPITTDRSSRPTYQMNTLNRFLGKTRTTGGTEIYKPPEQAFSAYKLNPMQSGPVDKSYLYQVPTEFELRHPIEFAQKGDIFSFGITLYQLFRGIVSGDDLVTEVEMFRMETAPTEKNITEYVHNMLRQTPSPRPSREDLVNTFKKNLPPPQLAIYGLFYSMLTSRVSERPSINDIVNVLKGLKILYPMPEHKSSSSEPCSSTCV